MGTSADRSAGTGGAWTPLKHAATSYVRGLNTGRSDELARRVLARHVAALGGAAGAAASTGAGRSAAQRLGALLAGIGSRGLASTLAEFGLDHLIGQDRFVVLDELVTFVAGSGDDLDAQAARDALCDVLDELFGTADAWEELSATTVTETELRELVHLFLTEYVYNRVPIIAERLSRELDPVAMRKADEQMRGIVAEFVELNLPEDVLHLDWQGGAGKAAADAAIEAIYVVLAALEETQ